MRGASSNSLSVTAVSELTTCWHGGAAVARWAIAAARSWSAQVADGQFGSEIAEFGAAEASHWALPRQRGLTQLAEGEEQPCLHGADRQVPRLGDPA